MDLFLWSRLPGYAVSNIPGDTSIVYSMGEPPSYLENLQQYNWYKGDLSFNPSLRELWGIREHLSSADRIFVTGWARKSVILMCMLMRLLFAKRTVCMIDTPYKKQSFFRRTLGGLALKLCFSDYWVSGNRSRLLLNRAYIHRNIYEGLYRADASVYQYVDAKRENLVFVGRIAKEKGIEGMLESISNKGIPIIIIGDGPLKNTLERKYTDNITWMGWKKPKEIAQVLSTAKYLLLLSNYEPWGVVVQEALFCGTPVIYNSNIGAADDLLTHGFNGFNIELTEIDLILEKSTPSECKKLQENCLTTRQEVLSTKWIMP